LAQAANATLSSAQILSETERARAARFLSDLDRLRFIARRVALRVLLGRYLGLQPDQVRFEYTAHGKPLVAAILDAQELQFNLAHSEDLALVVLTRHRAVGIDVERIRPLPNLEEIAATVFSPLEKAALAALPEPAQLLAFYRGWTRKEAYVKARGMGLASSFDQFTVSLAQDEPARLVRVEGNDAEETARWSLRTLEPAAGYVGALAVKGHGWRLSQWHWSRDREG
jgi:4'-phosphopantetheinyl transferase